MREAYEKILTTVTKSLFSLMRPEVIQALPEEQQESSQAMLDNVVNAALALMPN